MSARSGRGRARPGAQAPGTGRATAAPTAAAAPPLLRDPWAWVVALSVVPLILHSLGAPLGEPFADDFDYLYRALLVRRGGFLDGYGSTLYWRPLGRQVYFGLLSDLILAHPWVVVVLHVAALAATALLIYRALRLRWPGLAAAVAASFVLFAESSRMLIAWPSHFMDLGALLLGALALHEAAHRRLPTALAAALGSLLSKEVGVLTALLLPWMPGPAMSRRARLRWTLAVGALVLAWGLTYLWVCAHAGVTLPHRLEKDPHILATPPATRLAWALWNCARAMFSLEAHPNPGDRIVAVGVGLLIASAIAWLALDAKARGRGRAALPWVAWGLAWFVLGSTPLIEIYPSWEPYRGAFGGIGLGIAIAGLLAAAHPGLLVPLVALRLVTFGISPGPPASITIKPDDSGAAFDFGRLVRLERLMATTRETLKARYPTLPRGASVGQLYLPWVADYALAGSRALQVWYRDSTLRWVRYEDFQKHPEIDLTTVVDYEARPRFHLVLLEPAALRHCVTALHTPDWELALREYSLADSIERGVVAPEFQGTLAAARAVCLVALGRSDEAEQEARRGITLWPGNPDAYYALGLVWVRRERPDDALREVRRVLAMKPDHRGARELLDTIQRARAAHRPLSVR